MTLGIVVPEDSLTEREAARILELPIATLRGWRLAGLLRDGLVRGKMSNMRTAPVLYWRAGVEASRELADPKMSEDVGGIFRRDVLGTVLMPVETTPALPRDEAAPRRVTWAPGEPVSPRGAATESESADDTVADEPAPTVDLAGSHGPVLGVSY